MSSELIRNRCSYAGSLWTFTVAARNGNIRAGFGCEGRVSGGVDEVVEVHRCRHGVLFPHPQPGCRYCSRQYGACELTRPLLTLVQEAGFCLSVSLPLQVSPTGQLAAFGRGSSLPH